jgi:large subunit ribosomal protein L31e
METKGKEEFIETLEDNPDDKITEEQTEDEIEEILSEEDEVVDQEEEETPTKPSKKKEKEDEDIVEERIYTIPLGKALVRPPKKRAPRAITLIREFVKRHMKMDTSALLEEEKGELPRLTITNPVNEKIWSRSIKKPPRKIRVRVTKDKEDNVKVFLAEGE